MVTATQSSILVTSFQVFDTLSTILQQESIKFEVKVNQDGNWLVQVQDSDLVQAKCAVDSAVRSLSSLKVVLDSQLQCK